MSVGAGVLQRASGARACIAALAAVAVALAAAPATAAETHKVLMDGTGFVPAQVTARRGDRIVWVNKDPFPHTATAPGAFDSGNVAPGATWTFTATSPGTFAYVCTLHPGMKGVLVVK